MAKHITENEINTNGATLGQTLLFDGEKFVPGAGSAQDKIVGTIADRDALDTTELRNGQGVVVGDATGDPTVSSGAAYYKWNGAEFIKISEAEANESISNALYLYATWTGDVTHAPTKDALAQKFKELDDTISLLAPEKAALLSAITLGYSTSGAIVKIAAGLPATAYAAGHAPGSTIWCSYANNYTISATNFRSGKKDSPASYGSLSVVKNANGVATTETYDLSTGVGRTGNVEITSLQVHENFWEKASARYYVTRTTTGYETTYFSHTEAGASAASTIYYDNFAGVATIVGYGKNDGIKVSKWLSGREFLGLGSSIMVDFSIFNLYRNTYVTGDVVRVETTGGSQGISPSGIPRYNDQMIVTDYELNLTQGNQCHLNPSIFIRAYRPTGESNVSFSVDMPINTYGIVSTRSAEYFQDEHKRLTVDGTAFDSSLPLAELEAQVSNGRLSYSFDYSKTAPTAFYVRDFDHVSAATTAGTLSFTGITSSDIAAFATGGQLEMYLILEDDNIIFDLGKPFGQNNGDGSGNGIPNSRGARTSASGSTLNFSFGTYSSANNQGKFTLMVLFAQNSPKVINSIVVS